ncbi:C-type lectin domain family 4 member A-like isoform X1 [Cebidichthys violaceus]|uniref:C-type lectin domain family 4 member A-like isoform X1 n=1 Tax=Cebidichthys violaceus TaxID=271503 RepID=UPI0035CC1D06
MAEVEVNYASVVFKSNKQAPPEAKKEEETVYDEVHSFKRTEQTADTNADKRANSRRRPYQQLACCLGILCVILLLGLIAVSYILATLSRDVTELNQLKENRTTLLAANRNLTNLNDKLSLDNDNLRRERNNLTVQLGNLTQNYTVLESRITNRTTQNQDKLNVSRAQWSIDAYCPKINNGRRCKACQYGWKLNKSSCYLIHNVNSSDQITWKEARENCSRKNAELAVVQNQQEKDVINGYNGGNWIGLRVEDGKWKWIDGTELTQTSWIEAPTEGHCAVSVKTQGWKSVRCDKRRRWICKQEALSV